MTGAWRSAPAPARGNPARCARGAGLPAFEGVAGVFDADRDPHARAPQANQGQQADTRTGRAAPGGCRNPRVRRQAPFHLVEAAPSSPLRRPLDVGHHQQGAAPGARRGQRAQRRGKRLINPDTSVLSSIVSGEEPPRRAPTSRRVPWLAASASNSRRSAGLPGRRKQRLAGRKKANRDDQGDQQETRPPHQPRSSAAPGKQEAPAPQRQTRSPTNGTSGQLPA